jgi:acetate kinase
MSFTPSSGVPMSSRSGDLDPGLAGYLARTEQMTAREFSEMSGARSGLLGMSETSADMHTLLACEAGDVRAAEAVAVFCYQVKKCVGSFVAALGGLDTLVFAGGIGENATAVRERVCRGLSHLGVTLDPARNDVSADVVSTDSSACTVRVVQTDEEAVIARETSAVLKGA